MSPLNEDFYEEENKVKRIEYLASEIADNLMQSGCNNGSSIIVAAYMLYKASQYNNPFGISLDAFIDGSIETDHNVAELIKKHITHDAWERLLKLVANYSSDEFAKVTLLPVLENDFRSTMTTPDSIVKLAKTILDVKEGEKVADVCCGSGTFLISAAQEENRASYSGFEMDMESAGLALIRAETVQADVEITLCDAFTLADKSAETKYDKIFANYPFGLKLRNLGAGTKYLEKLSKNYPGLSKATSSDWVFNALLCDLLSEDGKAVGIMTNGSTWNSIDLPMRKYFVEQHLVECVISLPNKMFSSTNIPTTMIVLSHGNETIRMVDATSLCRQGRRQNEFSNSDIEAIVQAMNADSDFSKEFSLSDLRENEYSLSLSRYSNDDLSFSNGVPFESVIKSITRGAPCTASQLDEMVSDSITDCQYLMLGNIQHGMIDDKLPYLSKIEPKYEKYCLKNNTLILSKNGYPYKVAVASVKEGQKILANGNLYIIELDETKANPYYIKAFFESDQGGVVLKNITVGATIPNIGVDKLKKVMIPLPSLEEQAAVADKYQAVLDEITDIKLQLENAIAKLRHIFDEGGE